MTRSTGGTSWPRAIYGLAIPPEPAGWRPRRQTVRVRPAIRTRRRGSGIRRGPTCSRPVSSPRPIACSRRSVDDPTAPRDLKTRAGMLRALARGRAVATREPGASRAAYLEALEGQVRDFPLEPVTGEARWLLGQVRLAAGRPEEAMNLWSGITHSHPRWLEARLLIADRLRKAVEIQRINRDQPAIAAKMNEARASLRAALASATDGPESAALTLQLASLELIPEVGRPSEVIDACERLLKQEARPEQHRMARLDRMVALAQAGRATEAEKIARDEVRTAEPVRPPSRPPIARLLGGRGRFRADPPAPRPDRSSALEPAGRPPRPASPRLTRRGAAPSRPGSPVFGRCGRGEEGDR